MNLTDTDLDLIQRQCENQGATSPQEIAALTAAYAEAKSLATDGEALSQSPAVVLALVSRLGELPRLAPAR